MDLATISVNEYFKKFGYSPCGWLAILAERERIQNLKTPPLTIK
jgi:hypothetical protein